jgi:hypothetical protein
MRSDFDELREKGGNRTVDANYEVKVQIFERVFFAGGGIISFLKYTKSQPPENA